MIRKGSEVRHRDPKIHAVKGIMVVIAIRDKYAICGYGGVNRLGQGMSTYLITELEQVDI